jgi:serine/threonine protein kinase
MIRGLRELHSRGILHRDVKPGNLVVRPSRRRPIAFIDFGLSRQFIHPETGQPLPRRPHPGFVGTPSYASMNALRGRELSQRDDLMSMLYSLVELRTGSLPWRDAGKNRPLSLALRLSTPPKKLYKKCPRQFIDIHRVICACKLFEVPNYDLLIALLCQAMEEGGCAWTDALDWDLFSKRKMKKLTPIDWVIPDGEREPNIPTELPEPVCPEGEEMEELDEIEEGDICPRGPVCGGCSLFWCGC